MVVRKGRANVSLGRDYKPGSPQMSFAPDQADGLGRDRTLAVTKFGA